MTMARAHLVDVSVTRWYHCVTRCVRRAFLLGEGLFGRKEWIDRRLEELSEIFAVSVGGFSVLDNHLHLLLRLDPIIAKGWSDEEVVRHWGRLFPPRDKSREPLPVSDEWVEWRLKDAQWVAKARERLQSLSWFMKCLKEPLARLANRQDQTRGAFFEGRFKSVAILDEESILATYAYIDLNPLAAGIVAVPEASPSYVDQSARGARGSARANQRLESSGARQHGGIECVKPAGRVALALRGRGSARGRLVPRGEAGRLLAGQLPAFARLHRSAFPRGQGHDFTRAVWDPSPTGK
jgi:hypothetical protein